jgi:hypothetical protein
MKALDAADGDLAMIGAEAGEVVAMVISRPAARQL